MRKKVWIGWEIPVLGHIAVCENLVPSIWRTRTGCAMRPVSLHTREREASEPGSRKLAISTRISAGSSTRGRHFCTGQWRCVRDAKKRRGCGLTDVRRAEVEGQVEDPHRRNAQTFAPTGEPGSPTCCIWSQHHLLRHA